MLAPFTRPRFVAPAAPGGTPWLSNGGTGSLRNETTLWVGAQLTIGAANITLVALGRVFITGNGSAHDVGLFDSSGNPIVIVSVDCSSGTNNAFNYTSTSPQTLTALGTYFLASLEIASGDQWRDNALPASPTGVAVCTSSCYRLGSGTTGAFTSNIASQIYVPPNFQYT